MNKEDKKFKYKVRSFRLSDEVWEKLMHKQRESGKSWNLFVLDLINKK